MNIELTGVIYGKAWMESVQAVMPEIKMLLRQDVAKWFAYTIDFGEKYEIDHRNDPPWDCSGTVFRLDVGYKLTDYVTLNDFLDEPNDIQGLLL